MAAGGRHGDAALATTSIDTAPSGTPGASAQPDRAPGKRALRCWRAHSGRVNRITHRLGRMAMSGRRLLPLTARAVALLAVKVLLA